MSRKPRLGILKIGLASAALSVFSCLGTSLAANPPVPPQRPKILHVSPEYIKKLMEERNIKTQPAEAVSIEEPASLPEVVAKQTNTPLEPTVKNIKKPSPLPPQPATEIIEKTVAPNVAVPVDAQEISKNTLQDTTRQDVLNILDSKKADVPRPREKPTLQMENEAEKTLVSFSLKPSEISLDDSIIAFLNGHALNLFNEDKDMTMEINAYATPVANEEHSSVRISLARALEVRKWLMDNNISPSRLKLNTTRNDKDVQSDDRIDLIIIQ